MASARIDTRESPQITATGTATVRSRSMMGCGSAGM